MRSLKEVLETIEKYNTGAIPLSEEVVECQKILRESEVVGEEVRKLYSWSNEDKLINN